MKKIESNTQPQGSAAFTINRELVLYVEDEEENWKVAELRLHRTYELLWAKTADEACHLIRKHRGALAAILMDIQLKGSACDGIELTRSLRGISTSPLPAAAGLAPLDVPIIFVTANSGSTLEPDLIKAGGDKLITKPVNFASLTLALTHLSLGRIKPRSATPLPKP